MPHVYVISLRHPEIERASEYGNLVYLSGTRMAKFDTSTMYKQFLKYLDRSNPEDYLLLSGLSIMCGIACAIFATKHKCLNLLIWSAAVQKYVVGRVEMPPLEGKK